MSCYSTVSFILYTELVCPVCSPVSMMTSCSCWISTTLTALNPEYQIAPMLCHLLLSKINGQSEKPDLSVNCPSLLTWFYPTNLQLPLLMEVKLEIQLIQAKLFIFFHKKYISLFIISQLFVPSKAIFIIILLLYMSILLSPSYTKLILLIYC